MIVYGELQLDPIEDFFDHNWIILNFIRKMVFIDVEWCLFFILIGDDSPLEVVYKSQ